MSRGSGRAPKYVIGRDKRPIVGLSREKPSGRYYATHSQPRQYFGTDLGQAVMKFRLWEADRGGGRTILLSSLQPLIPKVIQEECIAEGWSVSGGRKARFSGGVGGSGSLRGLCRG